MHKGLKHDSIWARICTGTLLHVDLHTKFSFVHISTYKNVSVCKNVNALKMLCFVKNKTSRNVCQTWKATHMQTKVHALQRKCVTCENATKQQTLEANKQNNDKFTQKKSKCFFVVNLFVIGDYKSIQMAHCYLQTVF